MVFLAKGPRIASIQEALDCLGLYHSDLEGSSIRFPHAVYMFFHILVDIDFKSANRGKCVSKEPPDKFSVIKRNPTA